MKFLSGFGGDPLAAFKKVYDLHFTGLTHMARSLVKNDHEAEEIVSDSFVKLWQRFDRFDGDSSVKAFLYITTKNRCFDFLRRQQLSNQIFTSYPDQDAGEQPHTESVEKHYLVKRIGQFLKTLGPQCAEVFLLMMEGYTDDEIAATLGIKKNAVHVQKNKGRKKFREYFGDSDVFEGHPLLFFFWLAYHLHMSQN